MILSRFRLKAALSACAGLAVLSGCQTTDPEARLDRYGTVFGDSDYAFVVGANSGSLNLRDVAAIAETIGVYKRLNASESEKIRALAQTKLDGYVLAEMRALEPQARRKKQAIAKKSRIARASAPTEAARQKIDAQERASIIRIEQEWRRSALTQVERKYGSDLAIPIRTRDRKPAVALAKVKDGEVQPPKAAYELNGEIVGRGAAAVRHGNVEATVIDEPISIE
ncbi:MAG: hypothetical protein ACI8UO_003863 [Verrucomicrobiales bacterium]|jgi:hypothetical protein